MSSTTMTTGARAAVTGEWVGSWPLLTADEEVELAKAIEAGVLAQQKLETTNPTGTVARELAQLVHDGEAAWERFINSNLRLVRKEAARVAAHHQHRVSAADLFQEGVVGLVQAAKKFDYTKGCKFSTYATRWISMSIDRSLPYHLGAIRIPERAFVDASRVVATAEAMKAASGRTPSNAEVAVKVDMTEEKVAQLRFARHSALSYDAPMGDDGSDSLGGLLAADDDVESDALDSVLIEMLHEAISELAPRRQQVVALRFGMTGSGDLSYREIAKELGCEPAWARTTFNAAIQELRELLADRADIADLLPSAA